MRILLVVLVVVVFVDAFFYSGAYTQSAYRNLKAAADEFIVFVGDVVEVGPDGAQD